VLSNPSEEKATTPEAIRRAQIQEEHSGNARNE
jgi:hypothetical protein